MLLEDDPELWRSLADLIGQIGDCAVRKSVGGAISPELGDESPLDAIIMNADAMETADEFESYLQTAQCPIILMADPDSGFNNIGVGETNPVAVLTKPFSIRQLMNELEKIGDDNVGRVQAIFYIGGQTFMPASRTLIDCSGNHCILREKESALLESLAVAAGEPVTRDALLFQVFGYRAVADTHTLDTHIYNLRQKIEIDPRSPKFLRVSKGGYRLEARPASSPVDDISVE